jgi:molybdopterin-guanine dinucleotide biosynthesis protein A
MNFTAVLLAGGQSHRMGQDKAGVPYEGEPLWRRQLATLRALRPAPSELLISGNPAGPYASSGVPIVQDEEPGRGPLGGLVTALEAARNDLVLMLAIDMPRMSSAFLGELLSLADAANAGVVPFDSQGAEPLAAVYTRACLPLARKCMEEGKPSMKRFIELAVSQGLLRPYVVNEPEESLFWNVNSPADLIA